MLLDASNARKHLKMNTKKLTYSYLCYVICSHAQTVTRLLWIYAPGVGQHLPSILLEFRAIYKNALLFLIVFTKMPLL
jgi:hypothetical protein